MHEYIPSVPLSEQCDVIEAHLEREVVRSEWDKLANLYDAEPLPSDTGERLEAIQTFSDKYLNFRGMFAGTERQGLDYTTGEWGARLGLSGIDDPDSDVTQRMMAVLQDFGLTERQDLPSDVRPDAIVALGCFGVSLLHRIQTQHGLVTTKLDANGNYAPRTVQGPTVHPALAADDTLRVTLSSYRALLDELGESSEATPFAPLARTEFDLALAASRHALGNEMTQQSEQLENVGYAYDGPAGSMVTQQNQSRQVINICAPTPTEAERGRAQTLHTYRTMALALADRKDTAGDPLLAPGSAIAIVTNADYAPFQQTAAVNAMSELGWQPHMITFTAEDTGVARFAQQPQLRLLPELHSNVRQLGFLHAKAQKLIATLTRNRVTIT